MSEPGRRRARMMSSMRTRIKICGVRDVQTALAAAAAGADAIGLVFVEDSPRVVTLEQARAIIAALPAFVEPVGLFVNRPVEQVMDTAEQLELRTVQLHGDETPGDVAQLTGLRVIKAMSFENAQDAQASLQVWQNPPAQLAALLFDTPPLPDATVPGGSGRSFDWNQLVELMKSATMESLPPIILAGGLTPQNVAEAMERVKPYAVDVSSGVESSRGVKDVEKILRFCQAVR